MTLWSGRFSEPSDDDLRALNDSIKFDRRLYKQDIQGSIAYAKTLADANVLTNDEASKIVAGLQQVLAEFESDKFVFKIEDEDIHTAVERRLTEFVGPLGGKLHTGRSRNDQVATDFRLWAMVAADEIDSLLADLQRALIEQSQQHVKTLMPGYTHLQPAQPITTAHWLMSFFWMIVRDRERLRSARNRTSVLPLGSGALAGSPFGINRAKLVEELGFDSYSQNSIDAVSDRDFVVELIFILTLLTVHLSRFAEDIIIYSNPLFGFISLDDRYSTGSSLMPQKRNADPMELTRGKAGRMIGYLTGLLSTLKALPSGYNKDLQEDKEALFDSVDTAKELLPVIIAIVHTLNFNPDAMRAALSEDMLATDLADYLVRKGVPFREAHHHVGRIVRIAADKDIPISQIPVSELQEICALFSDDVEETFDYGLAVARKNTPGGTAPEAIRRQITEATSWLEQFAK